MSSAHSGTADTCLTQAELSIFSPRGLSCLCVCGDDESTMEEQVWMRRLGGAEDVEERKGRRGVCLNLDVQLPEEHVAPGTKSQYHALLPLPAAPHLSLLQQHRPQLHLPHSFLLATTGYVMQSQDIT